MLSLASREDGLEVNTEKTKYIVISSPKCKTKSQFADCYKSSEYVAKFK
jgi:hypothetical protein